MEADRRKTHYHRDHESHREPFASMPALPFPFATTADVHCISAPLMLSFKAVNCYAVSDST
ncbi:MAG: hypothetical protein C0392_05740 [Syntrophus sp. (in: bacteria)]|nr:hypothetical protein [Syntrophus sp. (in: bacteria)]